MPSERISATYLIETPLEVARAAAILAGEQSSGTFVEVPGETDEIRNRYRAIVEQVEPLESAPTASLPFKPSAHNPSTTFNRARIVISWSIENMGHNLPTLLATVAGNLYELKEFSGLKLIDLNLPASFGSAYRGPAFGIPGTRKLTTVQGRPLIGTIIKPSIGLSPEATANLVSQLADAGIDFIKDDELMANPPHSPFTQRVDAVMNVLNTHADRTGKKVMYAFNISDEIDAMQRNYDKVRASGGTAIMLSLNHVGLSAVKKICDIGTLAVHGHRNGWGMLNRHPMLGMDFVAYQKIWRLAGVDQIHVNGIANKFWEPDDSVVRSINACIAPMFTPTFDHNLVLPVVSSGQTGLQAPETWRRTKTTDLLYMAGGGIMAHPGGPGSGVRALRQAWEAATADVSLADYARTHTELRQTIEMFDKKTPKSSPN
jgi:ribulose-bisphosphate carboxylase large chain